MKRLLKQQKTFSQEAIEQQESLNQDSNQGQHVSFY